MNKQRVDFPVGENACQGKRGTPRGRLVELLKNANKEVWNLIHMSCCEERLKLLDKIDEHRADYLLANGVIVPPCKVGYYIWFLKNDKLTFGQVEDVTISRDGTYAFVFEVDEEDDIIGEWTVPLCDFGKTVFLTKEEAEAKLKEGVQGASTVVTTK